MDQLGYFVDEYVLQPIGIKQRLMQSRGFMRKLFAPRCVIGDLTFRATSRVASLTPELAKGLEFDLVVLIDPDAFGTGIEGAVDRYVAMTRATQRLVILTSSPG